MENTIKTKAYIPSASEYDKYFSRFRAFMSAKLSKKAKENGTWENSDYGKGYFFLRSALASYIVYYGDTYGTRGWCSSHNVNAGLRVAFQTIYNPQSSLVKGSRKLTQTSLVFDNNGKPVYDGNGERKKVTSTATIVKFGGKDCIWLNEEECKNGSEKTMKFWTLELIDKAVPFDRDGKHNDYAKATELQNQCYDALTENCTEEEKAMLLEVEMSSEDGYEKATPILTINNINKRKENKIIFNPPATILFKDGKKYVAKCHPDDIFDEERGLMVALLKSFGIKYRDLQEMLKNAKCPKAKMEEIDIKEGKSYTESKIIIINGNELTIGTDCETGNNFWCKEPGRVYIGTNWENFIPKPKRGRPRKVKTEESKPKRPVGRPKKVRSQEIEVGDFVKIKPNQTSIGKNFKDYDYMMNNIHKVTAINRTDISVCREGNDRNNIYFFLPCELELVKKGDKHDK